MRKLVAALALITFFAAGAVAYAHGTGNAGGHMGQGYGGQMMGNGYGGGHMMGQGYGGHMMGSESGAWKDALDSEEGQKFLDETVGLRKQMNDKKFELREAYRHPETTLETITTFEREIQALKEKIREKAPLEAQKRIGGNRGCWQ